MVCDMSCTCRKDCSQTYFYFKEFHSSSRQTMALKPPSFLALSMPYGNIYHLLFLLSCNMFLTVRFFIPIMIIQFFRHMFTLGQCTTSALSEHGYGCALILVTMPLLNMRKVLQMKFSFLLILNICMCTFSCNVSVSHFD